MGHKLAAYDETQDEAYASNLSNEIASYLNLMCADKTNFPKLTTFNFNYNGYNEFNNGFDTILRSACDRSTTGVEVRAREVAVSVPDMCNPDKTDTYSYYNMTSEAEVAQCQFTWSWEYLGSQHYGNGPYPNENTPEC